MTGHEIAALRSSVPLAPLVGQHTKLHRRGRLRVGLCPFHGEKTPSFTVFPDQHWHCFGCQAHGDAIDFVRRIDGCSFADAVAQLTGTTPSHAAAPRQPQAPEPSETKGLSRYAARVFTEAVPITGTLAERYLRATRGLGELPLPSELRFHPGVWAAESGSKHPALLVPAFDGERLARFQAVLLDPATGRKAALNAAKLTFGAGQGHVPASLAAQHNGIWILLCEGPEDAVTLHAATGLRCDASLGTSALDKPCYDAGTHLIIVRDAGEPGRIAAEMAAEKHRQRGVCVSVLTPPDGRKDANELLQTRGIEAVRAWVNAGIAATLGLVPSPPTGPLPRGTLDDARNFIAHTTQEFLAPHADHELPRQILLASDGGSGKTDAIGRLLPEAIVLAKQAGRPHRAIIAVPEHQNLGRQMVERLRRFGLTVAHFRGRGDPFNPKPIDLCQNPESVAAATLAGQDIGKSCCGAGCPVYDRGLCQYLDQRKAAADADVIVLAHQQLKHHLPKPLLDGVGWLVIDEDCVGQFDRIYNLDVGTFSQAALDEWPVVGDPDGTRMLGWTYAKLRDAVLAIAAGRPIGDALFDVGLRSDEIATARKLEWRREVPAEMTPGMDLETRRELAERARINWVLPRIAAFWGAAQSALTDGPNGAGRLTVVMKASRAGTHQEIAVRTQYHLASWAADLPTLLLNATGRLEDVRRIFPRAVERRPDRIATPAASLTQILGGFSKGSMAGSDRKQTDVRAFLAVAFSGRQQGAVGHKSSRAMFDAMPAMQATWHGANAGDNSFKAVEAFSVFDGPRPRSRDIAAIAAARTGRAVTAAAPTLATETALMVDGTGIAIPVLRYDDPAAQAIHESIHAAAISQALARPRQVLRTAVSPVATLLFGNVAADRPVDAIVRWSDIRPDRLVHMVHRRHVTFNAADMARWHGDLFKTEKAASSARERFGDAMARVNAMLERDPDPWSKVRYQPAGQGQHVHTHIVPTADVDKVLAAARAKYGEMVYTDVDQFSPGRPKDLPIPLNTEYWLRGMSSRPIPMIVAKSGESPP